MAFVPAWQGQGATPYLRYIVVRTAREPGQMAGEVRRTLRGIDPQLPLIDVTTPAHQVDRSLARHKLITSLCGIFGMLALTLTAIGVSGSVAYSVAGRTREIGIRMAVGAQRREVLWMVLRRSALSIACGVAVGLPLALAAAHWIGSYLFGVKSGDPVAIGGAVAVVVAGALFAGYLPARRATRIDPMQVLRQE